MMDAFETSDRIEIDGSGVAAADVSFVQLIACASRSAAGAGKTLLVTDLPEHGRALFLRAGIEIDPAGAVSAN